MADVTITQDEWLQAVEEAIQTSDDGGGPPGVTAAQLATHWPDVGRSGAAKRLADMQDAGTMRYVGDRRVRNRVGRVSWVPVYQPVKTS